MHEWPSELAQLIYMNHFNMACVEIMMITSKKSLTHLKERVKLVQLHVEMLEPTIWFEQGGVESG